jgi:hypothetical protein
LGEVLWLASFALLILVATVTGAIAGERFPILQPDQMNADQKNLLEALLGGPRGAALALSPLKANTCRQASASLWVRQAFTLALRASSPVDRSMMMVEIGSSIGSAVKPKLPSTPRVGERIV